MTAARSLAVLRRHAGNARDAASIARSRLGAAQLRDGADDLAGRRVVDFDHVTRLGPRAVDVAGLAKQPCVLQLNTDCCL